MVRSDLCHTQDQRERDRNNVFGFDVPRLFIANSWETEGRRNKTLEKTRRMTGKREEVRRCKGDGDTEKSTKTTTNDDDYRATTTHE